MRPDQPQLAISDCLLQQRWLSAKQFPSPSCSRCPKTLLSEIVGLTKPTLSYEVPFRNRQPCGILSTSLASSCSVDSSWRSRADRPCLDAQTSAPQEPVLAAGESLILPQYLVPSTVPSAFHSVACFLQMSQTLGLSGSITKPGTWHRSGECAKFGCVMSTASRHCCIGARADALLGCCRR